MQSLLTSHAAASALATVKTLRKDLDEEHETGRSLGWSYEKRVAQVEKSYAAAIAAGEKLLRTLPEESAHSVRRYIKTKIVPGMKYSAQ